MKSFYLVVVMQGSFQEDPFTNTRSSFCILEIAYLQHYTQRFHEEYTTEYRQQ
jgi:hypothetical protein